MQWLVLVHHSGFISSLVPSDLRNPTVENGVDNFSVPVLGWKGIIHGSQDQWIANDFLTLDCPVGRLAMVGRHGEKPC